jgi:hypothetical protein
MSTPLSLKELERKAFRSTYQDGLWDLYIGVLTAINGVFFALPDPGEASTVRIMIMAAAMFLSWFLFWTAKRKITLQRLGQVKFGAHRQRRKVTLTIIMCIFVVLTILLVVLPSIALAVPSVKAVIEGILPGGRISSLLLGGFLGVFLALIFAVIAYYNDFPRGYYIAAVIGLSFFLALWLRNFTFLLAGAALIAIPGCVLLIRFLREHPLPVQE